MSTVQELDTPALVVDLDIMERNLRRVADYCAAHRLRLRPHTKTHKSIMLGRRQLALGAAGLTVAKVGEAEVMLGAAPRDLLVAFPVIGQTKLRRLAAVAAITRVSVALDSLAAATQLSLAAESAGVRFGVLVEVDVGLGRMGVAPAEALNLTRAVASLPGLDWRGITFYPGHIKDQNPEKLADLSRMVGQMVKEFTSAGLAPEIVSGGSTPTLYHSHEIEGVNEIRPGTYVFNDMNTVAAGACGLEDCAASILVTVVSHAKKDRMIVDGGSKTFSSDKLSSGGPGHGRLMEAPGASFHKMNEEHGFIDLTQAERSFEIGDKVRLIPNHICVAVNLHEYVYGVRGGQVEECWNVEGRGKLQ
ncbi:MAG TPA: alanine racemase [Bryobacteraceae bacterium]|nr:alanine racemase [Bryobacteraceae bacterium]